MDSAELRGEGGECGGLWSHVGGGGQPGGGGRAGQAGAGGRLGAGGGRGLETRVCPGLDPVEERTLNICIYFMFCDFYKENLFELCPYRSS